VSLARCELKLTCVSFVHDDGRAIVVHDFFFVAGDFNFQFCRLNTGRLWRLRSSYVGPGPRLVHGLRLNRPHTDMRRLPDLELVPTARLRRIQFPHGLYQLGLVVLSLMIMLSLPINSEFPSAILFTIYESARGLGQFWEIPVEKLPAITASNVWSFSGHLKLLATRLLVRVRLISG